MDKPAIVAPVLQSRCSRTADPAVATTDRMTPRMVFEVPKRGSPSGRVIPPSSGALRRSWSSFLAKIGVLLATPRRTRSCRLSIQSSIPVTTSKDIPTIRIAGRLRSVQHGTYADWTPSHLFLGSDAVLVSGLCKGDRGHPGVVRSCLLSRSRRVGLIAAHPFE